MFAVDTELKPPGDWHPTDALPTELTDRLGLTEVYESPVKTPPARDDVGAPGVPGERRPILDVPRRSGWPHGWRSEFAYVDFHGEPWEQRNVKTLFNETFKWLWENRREDLLRWNEQEVERSAFKVGLIAGSGHSGARSNTSPTSHGPSTRSGYLRFTRRPGKMSSKAAQR